MIEGYRTVPNSHDGEFVTKYVLVMNYSMAEIIRTALEFYISDVSLAVLNRKHGENAAMVNTKNALKVFTALGIKEITRLT